MTRASAGYSAYFHRHVLGDLKRSSRYLTKLLIADGIVRPRPDACECCGEQPGTSLLGIVQIQCHHLDYCQPELVEWLCRRCHNDRHQHDKRVYGYVEPVTIGAAGAALQAIDLPPLS
jgi:hypothetical protein